MSRLSRLGYIDAHRTLDPVRRRVRSRGVPPALEGHEVFYTEDPVEAARLIGQTLAPGRVTVHDGLPAPSFAASLHGVRLRDVSLLHLDLHAPATVDIPTSGAYFAVHMLGNGGGRGLVARQPVALSTVTGMVTNPGDAVRLHLDLDSPQSIIRIESGALEHYLTRLLARSTRAPVRFEPVVDLTRPAMMRWHAAIQLLHTEVFHAASLTHSGLGLGPLEDLVMSSLLLLQPSSYRELLLQPATRPGRRAVRRALDYLEQHLSEPVSLADIAEHVDASARTVQQGFRDDLGTTPMAWLRDRRLERVRDDLVDADPASRVTVTDVAQRWGFTHLGSFAGLYRQRWGESPSQTLRR